MLDIDLQKVLLALIAGGFIGVIIELRAIQKQIAALINLRFPDDD